MEEPLHITLKPVANCKCGHCAAMVSKGFEAMPGEVIATAEPGFPKVVENEDEGPAYTPYTGAIYQPEDLIGPENRGDYSHGILLDLSAAEQSELDEFYRPAMVLPSRETYKRHAKRFAAQPGHYRREEIHNNQKRLAQLFYGNAHL
jgi:hypothetical protein